MRCHVNVSVTNACKVQNMNKRNKQISTYYDHVLRVKKIKGSCYEERALSMCVWPRE